MSKVPPRIGGSPPPPQKPSRSRHRTDHGIRIRPQKDAKRAPTPDDESSGADHGRSEGTGARLSPFGGKRHGEGRAEPTGARLAPFGGKSPDGKAEATGARLSPLGRQSEGTGARLSPLGKHGEARAEATGARLSPLAGKQSEEVKRADKFDLLARAEAVVTDDRLPSPPPLPPSRHRPGSAMEALDNAQQPGVLFREEEEDGSRSDELDDEELAAAVEEAIRLLFGVRGIHRISPGLNQAGEKVVLISVARGFDETSLKAIPATVLKFPTLVALPYELLPLRRIRS